MSKVKDAVTLAMLLVAIVFSAGLLTLPEYSSAGLDVSGLSSAAPEGETYRPNVTSPPVSSASLGTPLASAQMVFASISTSLSV